MKKLILKIVSIVAAFLLGIVCMSYVQTAGNSDQTGSMADATLPLVYMERDGRLLNLMHGYTQSMDAGLLHDTVLPLSDDRQLSMQIQSPDVSVQKISYEVRSLDTARLIEDREITDFTRKNGTIQVEFQLKDLLDSGEEYLLVLHLEMAKGQEAWYYTRISNISDTHLEDCLEFAELIHEALFDKENTVSIAQYLESDSSADNSTLAHVTIHSRYSQMIWGDMDVEQVGDTRIYITEVEGSIASFRLEYEVSHVNEDNQTEKYEVQESFRVRYTEQRMYLLNYDRTVDRIFDPSLSIFEKSALWLGVLDTDVEYRKNEEENVVGFVQNGELWSYDVAQNKLSYVFGFRDGDDLRCSYHDHAIRIIDVDETGSMNFLVYGYMNRGLHEGRTGIAVYTYHALTNSVEERVFIESQKPFAVLQSEVGSLSYVSEQGELYLYLQGNICRIDLNTQEYTEVVSNISEECMMISDDGRTVAWHRGNSLYETEEIELLNLDTGKSSTIQAEEGCYIRALGFMGTDFIYGSARKEDIQKDITGNPIFPMGKLAIHNQSGEVVREFPYEEQGKYVVSISIESNWISLDCVGKTADGGYEEVTPELIANNTAETVEKIELSTKNSSVKKKEYLFRLTDGKADSSPRQLSPKQVLFEGSRNIAPEETEEQTVYYVYAFNGQFAGAYTSANEAVLQAYDQMGVVVDSSHSYIWKRGGRKTRTELKDLENLQPQAEESSLQAAVEILLSRENIYADTGAYLAEGRTAFEILSEKLEGHVLELSGCSVSMALYYVSAGYPVLALEGGSQAELITGYDTQNIILMNPLTGETYKKGMNDSSQMFEELGNLFLVYLPAEEL